MFRSGVAMLRILSAVSGEVLVELALEEVQVLSSIRMLGSKAVTNSAPHGDELNGLVGKSTGLAIFFDLEWVPIHGFL